MKCVQATALALLLSGCAIEPQPAELILSGGTVCTGVRDAAPAEAIALRRARVVHAGTAAEVTQVGEVGPYKFEVGDLQKQLAKDYDDLVNGRLPNA